MKKPSALTRHIAKKCIKNAQRWNAWATMGGCPYEQSSASAIEHKRNCMEFKFRRAGYHPGL